MKGCMEIHHFSRYGYVKTDTHRRFGIRIIYNIKGEIKKINVIINKL